MKITSYLKLFTVLFLLTGFIVAEATSATFLNTQGGPAPVPDSDFGAKPNGILDSYEYCTNFIFSVKINSPNGGTCSVQPYNPSTSAGPWYFPVQTGPADQMYKSVMTSGKAPGRDKTATQRPSVKISCTPDQLKCPGGMPFSFVERFGEISPYSLAKSPFTNGGFNVNLRIDNSFAPSRVICYYEVTYNANFDCPTQPSVVPSVIPSPTPKPITTSIKTTTARSLYLAKSASKNLWIRTCLNKCAKDIASMSYSGGLIPYSCYFDYSKKDCLLVPVTDTICTPGLSVQSLSVGG